jgi:hypothetical protein
MLPQAMAQVVGNKAGIQLSLAGSVINTQMPYVCRHSVSMVICRPGIPENTQGRISRLDLNDIQ